MGLLAQIDAELQKDLIDFVKAQEADTSPHTLGEALVKEILKDIINGNARISGCVTNHAKKRMYLELTFYEEDTNEQAGDHTQA
ncbi:MAG: hypothetical protein IKO25_06215 [Clostridia bacterium]|nr:hypothetical protein [Clostridia bacterium]